MREELYELLLEKNKIEKNKYVTEGDLHKKVVELGKVIEKKMEDKFNYLIDFLNKKWSDVFKCFI